MRLLLIGLIGCVLILSGCVSPGTFKRDSDEAVHRWSVAIQPADTTPYELEVPFFVAASEAAHVSDALEALRDGLIAPPGAVEVEWTGEDRSHLHIKGEGPVVLEAQNRFTGPIEHREAFARWHLPAGEVHSSTGGPLHVVWTADFSGGTGHTCWARAQWTAQVPAEGSGQLQDEEGRSIMGDGLPTECT